MQKWLNLKTMLGFYKKLMIVSFCERARMIKLRFFFEDVDNVLLIIYKNVIVTLNQERQLLIMLIILIIMMIIIIIIIMIMIMKGGAVMARVDWHWNSLPSPSPGGTDDNGS